LIRFHSESRKFPERIPLLNWRRLLLDNKSYNWKEKSDKIKSGEYVECWPILKWLALQITYDFRTICGLALSAGITRCLSLDSGRTSRISYTICLIELFALNFYAFGKVSILWKPRRFNITVAVIFSFESYAFLFLEVFRLPAARQFHDLWINRTRSRRESRDIASLDTEPSIRFSVIH
jgi:hypothetical protein